jgi:hypothetical protein
VKRRDPWILGLIVVAVSFEAWWVLSRNPVTLLTEAHSPILVQGNRHPGDESHGPIVPGQNQPPIPMGRGEGHGGEAPGLPAPPPVRAPGAPPPQTAAPTLPHDSYHRLLLAIIALDARAPLPPTQARQLIAAIRAREGLRADDISKATEQIYDALTPRQRAFLESWRAERERQGKGSTPPEELPMQIRIVLGPSPLGGSRVTPASGP